MSTLTAGGNIALPDGPWTLAVGGPFDLSAVVVSGDGKVRGDSDFVFFNQPAAPGVAMRPGAVTVDARSLRPGADRVVMLVSPEDTVTPLGRLSPPALKVISGRGQEVARFTPSGLTSETVAQLAEVYRRNGQWKLRAIGAGYADGLAGLVRDFGVVVDDEPQPATPTGVFAEVVTLTNVQRRNHGLVELTWETRLAAAAQSHNDDMVRRAFFAHENPDGASVADRVRATGYSYCIVAENIAAGQPNPAEVVEGWMNSPGHRKNILTPEIRQIGVGFTTGGEYGTMWTQVFGALL